MVDVLEGLNKKQREAVEYLDKPLLVFAGPGTGKTKVVTHKLAYLVKDKGFKPEGVVALTFSESAAQEMQERVEDLLPDTSNFRISTFHSFCNQIIREYALEVGINSQGQVMAGEHQQAFLLESIDNIGLEAFKVTTIPTDLAKTFQGSIARFKQENIGLERLEQYIKEKEKEGRKDDEDIAKLRDLARAYRLYEEFKEKRGLIDYGDMQSLAVDLLRKRPEILEKVRSRIKYVIVDEFQDTDYIQLQLVFLLAPDGNVTVVGDDDQSIYRFRGAYLTNVVEFAKTFKEKVGEPKRIVLKKNYRCTGNIQKVATALIGKNPERQDKDMETEKDAGEPVMITQYQTDWGQARGISDKIKRLHAEGVPYEDMAILFRRRIDSKPIQEIMDKNRIPYEVIGSREFFREPIIRAVMSYLRVLGDPIAQQPSLGHIMQRPVHGLVPGEIQLLTSYAKDKKVTLWKALDDLDGYQGNKAHLEAFRDEIKRLFNILGEKDLATTVRAILFGRDFFREEISKGDTYNIRLLNRFLQITSEYLSLYPDAHLKEYLTYLEALTNLGFEDRARDTVHGKVNLMTVHGSKGREFPYVFIPCLNKDRFPSKFREYKIDIPEDLSYGIPSKFGNNEIHLHEERRLLYVAITRGMEQVFIGYYKRFGNNKKDTPISDFVRSIFEGEGFDKEEIEDEEETSEEIEPDTIDGILRHRIISGISRGDWQQTMDGLTALAKRSGADINAISIPKNLDIDSYLADLEELYKEPEIKHAEKASYSPSKLRTYEECPKKYHLQYVLGIPDEVKTYFELGTVVHAVIEVISRRIKDGEEVTEEDTLKLLDTLWRSSVYESTEKEKQDREEAEKMVRDFLTRQKDKTSTIVDIERWIELDVEGRKIRGKVDRIDDVGDALEVIDYKTSKNRTSIPKLKEDFQMVLYWLGTEKAYKRPISQVGHWYLRMDLEWMIEITDRERGSVMERARKVINSIEEGEFNASPGYQVCKYCGYKNLCDMS